MESSNVAFTDAVARARQIAAKLGTSAAAPASNGSGFNAPVNPLTGGLPDKGNPNNMPLGVKRSFPGGGEDDYSAKKSANEPDAITAQLRALADQQRNSERTSAKDMAKMAAEQVAAKLNQSMGMGGGAPPQIGAHAGLGLVVSEDWAIPNRVVGLVIGSKGESITQIQAQSGCRIQIAPDPPPGQSVTDRHVALNGTAESIKKAKDLINKTINEAGQSGGGGMGGDQAAEFAFTGQTTIEMMIPGNKVGLIIGKGGETIKQLQSKCGCKMMMVQDGAFQNAPEKPLRITGDPSVIESAKRIVQELMNSKDMGRGGGGGGGYNHYGGDNGNSESLPVPREAVGIIIGKGGDMIKQIQGKFNVRIQFQNDSGGPQRMCDISGSPDDVYAAKQHVTELISENQQRGGGMSRGGGRGGGRGGFGGPPRGGGGGGFGEDSTTMRVPSERCGIVIGKGGENIRAICEMSGAHVELNRNAPPGPDKEFTIRGSPEQIQHAMHLISEKISVPPRDGSGGRGGGGGWGGPGGGGGPYGGGGGGWGGGGPHGGPPGPPQQQQGWGNYNYNQWGQQPGGQQAPQHGQPGGPAAAGGAAAAGGDPSQQSTDPAWQAYYAQYYSQYQQQSAGGPAAQAGQAAAPQAQPAASQAQPAASQPAAPGAATAGQPKINPATGQPDYSEQWAAYYRQMGWHDQADAILKQAQNGGQPAAQ